MSGLISSFELTLLTSALTFGLLSSLHCISMCGPLVTQSTNSKIGHVLYQFGRLISYQILGFILYSLSQTTFTLISVPLQKYSLVFLIIIYFYVGITVYFKKNTLSKSSEIFNKLYRSFFSKIVKKKNKDLTPLFMGLISGLLPCGLLHVFLLGVIPIERPVIVSLYIFCFWLSTSPVLLGVNLIVKSIKVKFKLSSPKITAGFYIFMGSYLIYIRFISHNPQVSCH